MTEMLALFSFVVYEPFDRLYERSGLLTPFGARLVNNCHLLVPSVFYSSSISVFSSTCPSSIRPPPLFVPSSLGSSPDTARLGIRICIGKIVRSPVMRPSRISIFRWTERMPLLEPCWRTFEAADRSPRSYEIAEVSLQLFARCKLERARSFLPVNVQTYDRSQSRDPRRTVRVSRNLFSTALLRERRDRHETFAAKPMIKIYPYRRTFIRKRKRS